MALNVFKTIYGIAEGCNVIIDNHVYRLHYKLTAFLLLVFSLLLTCRQYFGDPIACMANRNSGVDRNALNSFCWINSTYTIPKHIHGTVGRDIIFPGVGSNRPYEQDVIRQKYYQWVSLVLFFQAVLFYVPRYIWLSLEGGRLEQVINNLANCSLENPAWTKRRLHLIVDYLTVWKLNHQKSYAIKFAFCELLNFVNVVGQLYALQRYFGGQFFCYGHDMFNTLFNTNPNVAEAVMARVFPKVAKCTFNWYGPSGTIQNMEILCILPLNIANEKIFAFIFFWFLFVTFVTLFSILYRLSFLDSRVRFQVLCNRCEIGSPAKSVNYLLSKFDFGDCFFLCQMSKNMNPYFFYELVEELVKKFESMVPMEEEEKYCMEHSDDGEEYFSKTKTNRLGYLRGLFMNGSYKVKRVVKNKSEDVNEVV